MNFFIFSCSFLKDFRRWACVYHTLLETIYLTKIGGHFQDKMIEAVKRGRTLQTVGDNWNLRIQKRDMRKDSQNIHNDWFQFVFTMYRITLNHLPNVGHVGNVRSPDLSVFLANDDEMAILSENYKVLVAELLSSSWENLNFLKQYSQSTYHILTKIRWHKNQSLYQCP